MGISGFSGLPPRTGEPSSALDRLLQRMQSQQGFPAMSAQIRRVQQITASETENLGRLADEILKDVALTNKLLCLVNSAQYAHHGGIGTVSRAISLIGFTGVRNLATGLLLLEHMENREHAIQLRSEFLRAQFSASLAVDLCQSAQEQEQVYIAALFQNLGRLLAEFYFPDEARQVRESSQGDGKREQTASRQALGVDYDTLGQAVAHIWGLPEDIRRVMGRPEGAPPLRPLTEAGQRVRWVAMAANDLADTVLHHPEANLPLNLERQARRYAPALQRSAENIGEVTLQTRVKLHHVVDAIGLRLPTGAIANRLLKKPPVQDAVNEARPDVAAALAEQLSTLDRTDEPVSVSNVLPAADVLARGVEDVTSAMVEGESANDVLRTVLETIYRALGAQRILLCIRETGRDALVGRFGLGADASHAVRVFRASLVQHDDLFGALSHSGRDTLIRDAQAGNVATRLPHWHQGLMARSMLLLPLQFKGNTLGLIYVDKAEADGFALQDREMALLKTLRNQAIMALRQSHAS